MAVIVPPDINKYEATNLNLNDALFAVQIT